MGGIFWLLMLGVGELLRRGSESYAGRAVPEQTGGWLLGVIPYIYRLNWDFGIDIFLCDYYN